MSVWGIFIFYRKDQYKIGTYATEKALAVSFSNNLNTIHPGLSVVL